MTKKLVHAFIFLTSFIGFAQHAADRVIYLDSTFHETNYSNQVYYRIISDFARKQLTYKMTDYYKSGKIYSEGRSEYNSFLFRTGTFNFYYETGNLKEKTIYEKNRPLGFSYSWYEDGKKKIEGKYLEREKREDPDLLLINQFWNVIGLQTVKDGNGYYDLSDEKGCDEGNIANGLKDSLWHGTDNKYKFTYIEKYTNGKLISGVSTTADSIKRIYHEVELKPDFTGGIGEFYNYVAKNFRTPDIPGSKGGKIYLNFNIEKDGSVDDIQILKGISPEIDKEAYRILIECPNWKPGKLRGIPITVLYSLPIAIHSPP